jgi:signal transduction histidine kinase
MTNVQAETLNGGESGSWIRRVLGATVAPRTWLATFYLLLTLPLGILWFTLIVTGVALGLGLVVIWVGVPLLVVTIVVWVHAARLERWLIRTCLGVDIPDPSRRLIGGSAFRRLRAIVTDPATWKDFVYLILLLPLGIAWFTIVVTAWSAALGLLTVPAYYWAISGGLQIADTGTRQISIDTWPEALAAAAVGLVLTLLAPLVIRACAAIHAWIACGLLGRSGKAALSARVADLTQTRSRAVDAAEAERRRIERDLHDGAQARLVALAMDLGRAREHLDDNPTAAAELVAQAHEEAKRTLVELRGLARGIALRSSRTAGSTPRSRRSPLARRFRSTWRSRSRATARRRGSSRSRTSWSRRH